MGVRLWRGGALALWSGVGCAIPSAFRIASRMGLMSLSVSTRWDMNACRKARLTSV